MTLPKLPNLLKWLMMKAWQWFVIILMVLISAGLLWSRSLGQTQPRADGSAREIAMTAKRFSFTPEMIKVKQGEKIRLKLTAEDFVQGFSILELGVDETIEPGKETVVEFMADRKGSFRYFCSIECGEGHLAMQGKLIVE